MIEFKSRGDFHKLNGFLERAKEVVKLGNLDYYGRLGVKALSEATPKDTRKTADSWTYEIIHERESSSIVFHNTNIQNGVPIAIILQYGHGTKNGGWVEGIDYINPTIQPIFDKIAKDAWKEVTITYE